MSIQGTGIAAAVAQTALQAQQIARQRDRQKAQRLEDARRLRDNFAIHLQAIEEGEEQATQLRVAPDIPDRPTPEQDRLPQIHAAQAEAADTPAEEASPTPPTTPTSQDGVLYRHLDIQA